MDSADDSGAIGSCAPGRWCDLARPVRASRAEWNRTASATGNHWRPSVVGLGLPVALLLLLAACGEEGASLPDSRTDDEVVLDAIGRMATRDFWSGELVVCRDAIQKIRSRPGEVRILLKDAAIRACQDVDVFLVWDRHSIDAHRRALGRLVDLLVEHRSGPMALVVEAMPENQAGSMAAALRSGDPELIRSVLRKSWSWPVDEYVDLLREAYLRGIAVVPGRTDSDAVPVPACSIPDVNRRPPPYEGASWISEAQLWDETHGFAFARIRGWLASAEAHSGRGRPCVLVLYGSTHISGRSGTLRPLLTEEGYECMELIPFQLDLELAIRNKLKSADASSWVELAPGVYRPGLLTRTDWIDFARARKEQFDWILSRLPMAPRREQAQSVGLRLHILHSLDVQRANPVTKRYAKMPEMERVLPGLPVK